VRLSRVHLVPKHECTSQEVYSSTLRAPRYDSLTNKRAYNLYYYFEFDKFAKHKCHKSKLRLLLHVATYYPTLVYSSSQSLSLSSKLKRRREKALNIERDEVIGRSKSVHIPSLPSCPTGWAITCALLAAQKFIFPPPSGARLFARPILFCLPFKVWNNTRKG
jgi:hypothetical protein